MTPPPLKLAYARPVRWQPSTRIVNLFTAMSVIAVLTSGSVAWALLLMHHR